MNTRRQAIKTIALGAASFAIPFKLNAALTLPKHKIKLGVITDVHIGFVPKAADRLKAFLKDMRFERPHALLQLGDFAHSTKENQTHIDRFNEAHEHTLHVIGNHDIKDHGLKREDCLKAWNMPAPYYTKVVSGIRFIVLDGNETGSPTHHKHGGYPSYIGKKQQDWFEQNLKDSKEPVIILCHQPFAGVLELDNAKEMRDLAAKYKDKIIVCMNGHAHIDHHIQDQGVNYLHVNSASYYWLGGKVRMAEYKDPVFCTVTIDPATSTLTIKGKKSTWTKGTPADVNYFTGARKDWKQFVKPEISNKKINYSS